MRLAIPLASVGNVGNVFVPTGRQLAASISCHCVGQIGMLLRRTWLEQLCQAALGLCPRAPTPFGEIAPHLLRHEKLGVLGPAVKFLGQLDFFVAQRLAVGFVRCPACAARRSRCGCER